MDDADSPELEPLIVVEDEPTLAYADDKLELKNLADIVAGAAIGTRGPFTIGVQGEWGYGKTSVLRQARERIDGPAGSPSPYQNIVTVWFNAWQYEQEQNPLVPLVTAIYREVTARLAEAKRSGVARKAWDAAKKSFQNIRLASEAIIAATDVSVEGGMADPLTGVALGNLKGKATLSGSKAVKRYGELREDLEKRQNALLRQQTVYQLAFDLLGDAMHASVKSRDPKQQGRVDQQPKVVVFIDDLDRCFPTNAIRLLEHMKLVFAQPGFVFVLGVDAEILQGHLKHRYERDYHVEPRLRAGERYLDKIIQLAVDLPDHKPEIEKYARSVVEELNLRASLLELTDPLPVGGIEPQFYASLAAGCRHNPRQLIRNVNNLVIDLRLAHQKLGVTDPTERQRFLLFDVIYLAVREALGVRLARLLSADKQLCLDLAGGYGETIDKHFKQAKSKEEGEAIYRKPADRNRDTIVQKLRDTPDLEQLLRDHGEAWLREHEEREKVVNFLKGQRRDEEASEDASDVDPGTDRGKFEAAVRRSLGLDYGATISDQHLRVVQFLSLDDEGVGDDVLEWLERCPRLKRLQLDFSRFTGAGYQRLGNLDQLVRLDLGGTEIDDRAAAVIASLSNLQTMFAAWAKLLDAGAEALANSKSLQRLFLNNTKVGDAGAEALANSKSLQHLELNNTKVGDAGAEALANSKSLQRLFLDNTKVGDAGAEALANSKSLQHLELKKTKVSKAAIERLRAALPGCKIFA